MWISGYFWGAYASPRVVFGVSPNRAFRRGRRKIARGDACAPQHLQLLVAARYCLTWLVPRRADGSCFQFIAAALDHLVSDFCPLTTISFCNNRRRTYRCHPPQLAPRLVAPGVITQALTNGRPLKVTRSVVNYPLPKRFALVYKRFCVVYC